MWINLQNNGACTSVIHNCPTIYTVIIKIETQFSQKWQGCYSYSLATVREGYVKKKKDYLLIKPSNLLVSRKAFFQFINGLPKI